MRNATNLLQHELIGLSMRIAKSTDRKQIGMHGIVVDETKNLLVLEGRDGKIMRIPKLGRTFHFKLTNASYEIKGKQIAFDPVERVRKCKGKKAKRVR